MKKIIKLFIQIIKYEIIGGKLEDDVIKQITPDIIDELYAISKKHDLSHMVAVFLQKNGLLDKDDISKKFSQELYLSLIRYEKMQYEFQQICQLFEMENIAYVPLKGAVIRDYYAEPWHRTSCDLDILVRLEDLDRACELLAKCLKYKEKERAYRDVSLYSQTGIHLELHFSILMDVEKVDGLLENVWQFVYRQNNESCKYLMKPEYFLFHNYAHMLYHFVNGGCGVRMFVDILVLSKKMLFDVHELQSLCEQCQIWQFVCAINEMIEVWFADKEYNELTEHIESYVMSGGLYGTAKSRMIATRTKVTGKGGYLLQRIFLPYKHLSVQYPRLKKVKIFYLYYLILRWFRIFREDVFQRAKKQVTINAEISKELVEETDTLFKKLGL